MKNNLKFLAGAIFILFLAVIQISFASSLGCCFTSADGLCSKRAEQSTCFAPEGEYINSPDCAVAKCEKICCVLGANAEFITSRACEIKSKELGFNQDIRQTTEEECFSLANQLDVGACVIPGEYENNCKYTTREECSDDDNFHAGVLCSNPALNTICKKTTSTICYPEKSGDVHYIDDCGNPDEIKTDCDVESKGSLCRQTSAEKAICQSVDCVDKQGNKRKHGESWCSMDGNIGFNFAEGINAFFHKGMPTKVGSRFFKYSCLNGEINIDACDDNKLEYCSEQGGSAKCVKNDYDICVSANSEETFEEMSAECPQGMCTLTMADPECGAIDINTASSAEKKYYADKIIKPNPSIFPATTYLDSSGNLKASSGFCSIGKWFEYSDIVNLDENNMLMPDWQNKGSEFGNVFREELFKQRDDEGRGLGVCAPTIGGGESGYCYLGDFHAEVTFGTGGGRNRYGLDGFWYLVLDDKNQEKGEYGWAGLFDMNPSHWSRKSFATEPDCGEYNSHGGVADDGIYTDYPNSPSGSPHYYYHYNSDKLLFYGDGWQSNNPLADVFKNIGSGDIVSVPLNPYIVDWLNNRCRNWLGDCDGQANWVEVGGAGTNKDSWREGQEPVSENPINAQVIAEDVTGSAIGISSYAVCQSYSTSSGTNGFQCFTDKVKFSNLADCENYCRSLAMPIPESPTNPICTKTNNPKPYLCLADYEEFATADECDKHCKEAAAKNLEIISSAQTSSSAQSTQSTQYYIPCTRSGETVSCDIDFTCSSWKAPYSGNDCGKCGADGLPCTEYRCEALGQRCEWKNPSGADRAYCVSSTDYTAPKILKHTINPQSPIPPYSAVELTITTDEDSFCRYDVGASSTNYEDMKYDFGSVFGKEHKTRLNLPGQIPAKAKGTSQYELIQDDGKYNIYVRCADAAGNPPVAPYQINFEVMQTPDTTAPFIENLNPGSGSAIKYNTTSKQIDFKMNEPAECRWSSVDKVFDEMENNFSCDEAISDDKSISGYSCSGVLTGVSANVNTPTKYYIRCKDQPWLDIENPNPAIYHRNEHSTSTQYSLKASSPLKINELTPKGEILKSSADLAIEIGAVTSGGGYGGKAICKWRLFSGNYFEFFSSTNSSVHSYKYTSNLTEGNYHLEAKCRDESDNEVNMSADFNLKIDVSPPAVIRAYNSEGKLKIFTDEDSQCKYSNNIKSKCNFNFDSADALSLEGVGKEHNVQWTKGKTYYIKCRDYFGNENAGCGITIRTYN